MSIEPADVERGASSVALAQIIGTGSVREGLRRVEENVRDVIDVARERGFVNVYGGGREFYGLPAWQLLGATYGILPFVEWTRPIDGGWEARAVVRTVEGNDVGAAEAMSTRSEPNKRRSTDHDLRAMAQTRAMRNALRSVLGSALVLAGFDFADPDAPATTDQTKALWTLADRQGFTRDEAHDRAGVVSLKDLTREQASELIDAWSTLPAVEDEGTAGTEADGEATVASSGRQSASGLGKDPAPPASTTPASVAPAHSPRATGSDEVQGSGSGEPLDPWTLYVEALGKVASSDGKVALRAHAISHRWGWPPRPTWTRARLDALAEIAREWEGTG